MAEIISVTDLPADLQSAELIEVMVSGANARASRVAPCLASTDPPPSVAQLDEARLVLIGAVKRWTQAGAGAYTAHQVAVGAVSQQETFDTRQRAGYNLWPSEITDLQAICKTGSTEGSFAIDTAPTISAHIDWCSLAFGANYCSCGTDIAGRPIYET